MNFTALVSLNSFVKCAEYLLKEEIPVRDKNNQTLLMAAVTSRSTQAVELLINLGDFVNEMNGSSESPLFSAARLGHEIIVDVLIEAKAYVDMFDKDGNTPLKIAIDYGYYNIAEVLIKAGASPNIVNGKGLSPLYSAVKKNNVDIARSLILSGANVNALSIDGNTPLTFAVCYGHLELVKLLVNSGAFVNIVNIKKRTPIFYAAERECNEIVEILLKAGANVNLKDFKHATPLTLAIENGNPETVELLIRAGCDVDELKNVRCNLFKAIRRCMRADRIDLAKVIAYITLASIIPEMDLKMDQQILYLSVLKMDGSSMSLIKRVLLFSSKTTKPKYIAENELSSYWSDCENEILRMQDHTLWDGTLSLLALLRERNRSKLASYFEDLFRLQNKFPVYQDVISDQMVRASSKFHLLQKCFKICSIGIFPDLVLHKIADYIPFFELVKLLKLCCQKLTNDSRKNYRIFP